MTSHNKANGVVNAAVSPKPREWTKTEADKFMRMMTQIAKRQALAEEMRRTQSIQRLWDVLQGCD